MHQRIRRMSAEELFDSILVAAGHDKGLEDVPGSLAENNKTAAKKANAAPPGRKKGRTQWGCRSSTFIGVTGTET